MKKKCVSKLVIGAVLAAASVAACAQGCIEGHTPGLAERPIWFSQCLPGSDNGWAFSANDAGGAYYKVDSLMPGTYMVGLQSYWRPVIVANVPVSVGSQCTPLEIIQTGVGYRVGGGQGRVGLKYGQTFLPESEHLFMIQSSVQNTGGSGGSTTVNIRAGGPGGTVVYSAWNAFDWRFRRSADTQLIPGKKYYLEYVANTYALTATCDNDTYLDGFMYENDGVQPGNDLKAWILEDNDGYLTEYYNPYCGDFEAFTNEWGIKFTATGDSLIYVWALIGTGGHAWNEQLLYSVHQFDSGPGGPAGAQIGPTKQGFTCPWGGTPYGGAALWAAGEAPLVPGQTYYIKVRNQYDLWFDPCYQPDAPNTQSYKNRQLMSNKQWVATIMTKYPDLPSTGMSAPVVSNITATTAQVSWTTTVAAMTQLEYYPTAIPTEKRNTTLDENLITAHSVILSGLRADTEYTIIPKSYRLGYAYPKTPYTFRTAQGAVFVGSAKDEATGLGMDGVTITVTPGNKTTVTHSGGIYSIGDMEAGTYTLTASKVGYVGQTKANQYCAAGQQKGVHFLLSEYRERLINPGFESWSLEGWTVYGQNFLHWPSVKCGPYPTGYQAPTTTAHSGSCYAVSYNNCDAYTGGCYQRVKVQPGRSYKAGAWAIAYWGAADPTYSKSRIGIDPNGGTNPAAATWSPWLLSSTPLDFPPPWRWIETPFVTPSGNTVTVFLDYTNTYGSPACKHHLNCFDDVALIRQSGSPADAKSATDSAWVRLSGVALTSSPGQLGGKVYVEAQDRSSGIQAAYSSAPSVVRGDVASVEGVLSTSAAGERYLAQCSFAKTGEFQIQPVTLNLKGAGGSCFQCSGIVQPIGQMGPAGGVGLNSVGLLVRTAGQVSSVGAGFAMLSQGTDSVKALTTNLGASLNIGDFVVIDGIVGLELDGSVSRAVIQTRDSSDLVLKI